MLHRNAELVGMAWHVKRTSLAEARANHLCCGSRLQVNEFVRSRNGWIIYAGAWAARQRIENSVFRWREPVWPMKDERPLERRLYWSHVGCRKVQNLEIILAAASSFEQARTEMQIGIRRV